MDVEIAKCEKKLGLARMNLGKVLKIEAVADYEQTVPPDVQLANEDRVRVFSLYRRRRDVDVGRTRSGRRWRRR